MPCLIKERDKKEEEEKRTLHFLGTETRPVAFFNKSVNSNTTGDLFFLESTLANKSRDSVL